MVCREEFGSQQLIMNAPDNDLPADKRAVRIIEIEFNYKCVPDLDTGFRIEFDPDAGTGQIANDHFPLLVAGFRGVGTRKGDIFPEIFSSFEQHSVSVTARA